VNEFLSSASVVLDCVSAGDRRRRRQAVRRKLSRLAPVGAALVCLAGVGAAAAGWSAAVTLSVWIVLLAGLTAWAVAATREREITDENAAIVDRDAALHGEIRSAAWFARQAAADPWAAFHLDQAARRVQAIEWAAVYPPVRANGAWLAAAVLSVAAFAIPARMPAGTTAAAAAPQAVEALETLAEIEGLSPELTARLLELLAAIREGRVTPVDALASLQDLRAFLEMDPVVRERIAQLFDQAADDQDPFERADAPAVADAEAMADDQEWARENLASRLATDAAQRAGEPAAGEQKEQEASEKEGPTTEQSADGQTGDPSEGQAGARVPARRSEAADGAAVMMLGNASSSVGEPGSVFGGKRGNVRYGTSEAAEIAASLKRELVEAVVNTDRPDLDEEDDRRRKTQQSWSSLAYTKSAGRASFDRARTDAVRAVPDARRLVVEQYFVRPPAPDDQ
jgi:hypothetical protein